MASNKPTAPGGKENGRCDAAAYIEIMERNVVEIPKEAVLDQLSSGKHETDDGDAREDKRYPKPASFLEIVVHLRGFSTRPQLPHDPLVRNYFPYEPSFSDLCHSNV